MDWLPKKLRLTLKRINRFVKSFGRTKVFCVGFNKTGTTSLSEALRGLSIAVASQRRGEQLFDNWKRGDFEPIFRFIRTAQAFQDHPFSCPGALFRELDARFPGSKFILTVRDNPGQWYDSLVRFHSRRFGGGRVPTCEVLEQADYVRKGWIHETIHLKFGSPEGDPYRKEDLVRAYTAHNQAVRDHFRDRPNDLLVLNVAEADAYEKLCRFLGKRFRQSAFPWKNKTSEMAVR